MSSKDVSLGLAGGVEGSPEGITLRRDAVSIARTIRGNPSSLGYTRRDLVLIIIIIHLANPLGRPVGSPRSERLHSLRDPPKVTIVASRILGTENRARSSFAADADESPFHFCVVLVRFVPGVKDGLGDGFGDTHDAGHGVRVVGMFHLRLVKVQIFEEVYDAIGVGKPNRALAFDQPLFDQDTDRAGVRFGGFQSSRDIQHIAI
ncbi:uncharacterized protein MYCGRDRAFT_97903 [Zymoseptoria tritici IPO323]|uniref:Uncharacterized protein n=1 Tax=Zymoseptoria tritici (strain CBS 115943 / IPO323) TaxID=336722 RepID=F9XRQ8_ZYMTI|nr:uncharacterized protein MYCGRDRAFT_97903 [Zymoseptoria tritici IPO323]EGP82080.1 hypothetical protein MYCGRDRAFT_97903 [Zymoseptoria tritici IPO323]